MTEQPNLSEGNENWGKCPKCGSPVMIQKLVMQKSVAVASHSLRRQLDGSGDIFLSLLSRRSLYSSAIVSTCYFRLNSR
jgi:hypothetical protein